MKLTKLQRSQKMHSYFQRKYKAINLKRANREAALKYDYHETVRMIQGNEQKIMTKKRRKNLYEEIKRDTPDYGYYHG